MSDKYDSISLQTQEARRRNDQRLKAQGLGFSDVNSNMALMANFCGDIPPTVETGFRATAGPLSEDVSPAPQRPVLERLKVLEQLYQERSEYQASINAQFECRIRAIESLLGI